MQHKKYSEGFKKAASVLGALVAIVLLFVIFGIGPVLTILSMNAIFGLSIAVSFWNSLAVFWLSMIGVGIVRAGTTLGINSSIFSLFNKE